MYKSFDFEKKKSLTGEVNRSNIGVLAGDG